LESVDGAVTLQKCWRNVKGEAPFITAVKGKRCGVEAIETLEELWGAESLGQILVSPE
jgi:hypothetical protein